MSSHSYYSHLVILVNLTCCSSFNFLYLKCSLSFFFYHDCVFFINVFSLYCLFAKVYKWHDQTVTYGGQVLIFPETLASQRLWERLLYALFITLQVLSVKIHFINKTELHEDGQSITEKWKVTHSQTKTDIQGLREIDSFTDWQKKVSRYIDL